MLQLVGSRIRFCLERAAEARRRADESPDPVRQRDFLRLEQSWGALAQSEDFTERLGRFCAENRRSTSSGPAHHRDDANKSSGTPKKRLVSIVDDDEGVRESITDLLRSRGYVAVAFASAEAYLQSGLVHATGCLITDVEMPGMGGLDLHARLIADSCRMPVIFITGSLNEQRTQAHALKFGAIGVLIKPCKEQSLIEAVEKAVAVTASQ